MKLKKRPEMHIDRLLGKAMAWKDHQARSTKPLLIPHHWGQGRTVFGGLSCSLLYAAVATTVSQEQTLRSLNCSFVGPVLINKSVQFEIVSLSKNERCEHIEGRLIQDDKVAVICTYVFGNGEFTPIQIPSTSSHGMKPPRRASFIPQIPSVVPKFLRHVDLKLVRGRFPFMGSKTTDIDGWMRFTKKPKAFSEAHLIALIDAWPSNVLQILRKPVPASTLNWQLEFLHPHEPIHPREWLAFSSRVRQATDGYCHQEANIWDSKKRLIAISRQIDMVFD